MEMHSASQFHLRGKNWLAPFTFYLDSYKSWQQQSFPFTALCNSIFLHRVSTLHCPMTKLYLEPVSYRIYWTCKNLNYTFTILRVLHILDRPLFFVTCYFYSMLPLNKKLFSHECLKALNKLQVYWEVYATFQPAQAIKAWLVHVEGSKNLLATYTFPWRKI